MAFNFYPFSKNTLVSASLREYNNGKIVLQEDGFMLIGLIAALSAAVAALVCVGTEAFAGLQWLWLLPVSFIGGFLAWTLLAFLFVLLLCAVVDPDKQYEKDSRLYRTVVYWIVDAIFPIARIRVETSLFHSEMKGFFL